MKNFLRYFIFGLTSLLLLNNVAHAAANPFGIDAIYVFGDSLSDEGVQDNNPYVVAPKQPTWTITEGAIWPTELAELLGITAPQPNNKDFQNSPYVSGTLTGTDYAAGGATTNGLGYQAVAGVYSPPPLVNYTQGGTVVYQGQIESFLANTPNVDPNGLYVIWAGANDLFVALGQLPGKTPEQQQALLNATMANIVANLQTAVIALHNAGAKNIVVLDLPDLASTPQFLSQPTLWPTLELLAYGVMSQMNVALGQGVLGFKVYAVDVFMPLDQLVAQVKAKGSYQYTYRGDTYTITDVTDTACPAGLGPLSAALICENFVPGSYHDNYLFADPVHPTTQGQQIVANTIYTRLQQG